LRAFGNKVLRRILGPMKAEKEEDRVNCIMKSYIVLPFVKLTISMRMRLARM
jgi:hypothetical protein